MTRATSVRGTRKGKGMRQRWVCELCQRSGSVNFKAGAGIWEVVDKIFAQHAEKSPGCKGGRDHIRVPKP